MKTDKLLHLMQQKKAMRSGGALPLPKAQKGIPNSYLPGKEFATGAVESTISPIDLAVAAMSGTAVLPYAIKLSKNIINTGAEPTDRGWLSSMALISQGQLANNLREAYENLTSKQKGGLTKAQIGTPAVSTSVARPVIQPLDSYQKPLIYPDLVKPTPLIELANINQEYHKKYREQYKKLNTFPKTSGKTVDLTAGRYRGAKVPVEYLNMIVESAKRAGIDPLQSLAMAGRESTFLQDPKARFKDPNANTPAVLISGWDVTEKYKPYSQNRFLADKKIPSVKTTKDVHGWKYDYDQDVVNQYLTEHPELKEEYIQKVKSTPQLTQTNYFDLYHDFIKERGVKGYNPGDSDYINKVNKDMELLKSDPAFMEYYEQAVKKEGGLTADKAKEILHDKSVHGHPLTDKQRKYFGWVAGGKKKVKVTKPR